MEYPFVELNHQFIIIHKGATVSVMTLFSCLIVNYFFLIQCLNYVEEVINPFSRNLFHF